MHAGSTPATSTNPGVAVRFTHTQGTKMFVKLKEDHGTTNGTCPKSREILRRQRQDLTPGVVYQVSKHLGDTVELKGWGCWKFNLSLFEEVL